MRTSLAHKPVQVLRLVLKRKPFDVMRSGEKTEEFRDNTAYWRSRLLDKSTGRWRHFDYIEFSLGYHPTRPKFRVRFMGITLVSTVDRKSIRPHYYVVVAPTYAETSTTIV